MITIHTLLGFLLVIASIFLAIWQILSWKSQLLSRRVRSALLGLLDLQVLLGIITFILHPKFGAFLLHPLLMIIAVGLAHVFTKENRPVRVRLVTYILLAVLLILGVIAGGL